ncbi:hypothetical protein FVE85_9463 [Porphyridium purpureum]|uniref:Hexosyltransferase n=1 Tax=Porphyridium purpureum TaxID=35688 RepID=A0A5J4YIV1_PORPP|nr:hypothetical protein FVE85_9463 [Porphyridium purpureum]|eukprot:POR5119..scf261_15
MQRGKLYLSRFLRTWQRTRDGHAARRDATTMLPARKRGRPVASLKRALLVSETQPRFVRLLQWMLVAALVAALLVADQRYRRLRRAVARDLHEEFALPARTLVICIGSAPQNRALRDAARNGWLQWRPDGGNAVEYRFFTDHPDMLLSDRHASGGNLSAETRQELAQQLRREHAAHKDMVFQRIETGYGDKEHNVYGKRGLFQMHWSVTHYRFEYLLRVDDDIFLCLHRLLYEIEQRPNRAFFWGRFWCNYGRHRADENFMLFSQDVVNLLTDDTAMKLLPFDEDVTLGWNFGLLSWVLQLDIFDDQKRLDAQQGYLTKYMHEQEPSDDASHRQDYAQFCDRFMFAHHVSASVSSEVFKHTVPRLMYTVPEMTSPRDGCPHKEQAFIPGRHAAHLPNVLITLDSGVGA